MQDFQILCRLEECGLRYDPASGRYLDLYDADDAPERPSDEIAEQLGIPEEDLTRWEMLQKRFEN